MHQSNMQPQSIAGSKKRSLDAVIFGPGVDKVSAVSGHKMSMEGRVSKADESSFDESGLGGVLQTQQGQKRSKSGCFYCEVGVTFSTSSNEWNRDFHETC